MNMTAVGEISSALLRGMQGAHLPVAVSHGEGRAVFASDTNNQGVVLRYASDGRAGVMDYPANPNGSGDGVAGICNTDGRITLMMPHPERVHRNVQFPWTKCFRAVIILRSSYQPSACD